MRDTRQSSLVSTSVGLSRTISVSCSINSSRGGVNGCWYDEEYILSILCHDDIYGVVESDGKEGLCYLRRRKRNERGIV